MLKLKPIFLFFTCCLLLNACGFHLQQGKSMALPLQRLYLTTPDPYGILAKTLRQYLTTSHIQLVTSKQAAQTILAITQDTESQTLLSVGASQQTRQYELRVNVTYIISDTKGRTLIGPENITDARTITVTSNQILGSSNEANLFYQQIRRGLAYAILNRMASADVTQAINKAFNVKQIPKAHSKQKKHH